MLHEIINVQNRMRGRIAAQILRRYIERFDGLQGLPEFQSALYSCVPKSLFKKLVKSVNCFEVEDNTTAINIDGFINFRLGELKNELDAYIKDAVTVCLNRSKYFNMLDTIKQYVDETPEITEEIYISPTPGDADEAGALLDIILEFLPRKIFVRMGGAGEDAEKNLEENVKENLEKDSKFIDLLQYIFGSRVKLIS